MTAHQKIAPPVGSEITFQRTPAHHPETGFVTARLVWGGIVEAVDMNAKPIRLMPDQYEEATQ